MAAAAVLNDDDINMDTTQLEVEFEDAITFSNIPKFKKELRSYLIGNVGQPVLLLIVVYSLSGCDDEYTYPELVVMLKELGINNTILAEDDILEGIELSQYYTGESNSAVILDASVLAIEQLRSYQRDAFNCEAYMQYIYHDKPNMKKLRYEFYLAGNGASISSLISNTRQKLAEFPENPNCVAILHEELLLLDFSICVKKNPFLSVEEVARIFANYYHNQEEVFQVPSLE